MVSNEDDWKYGWIVHDNVQNKDQYSNEVRAKGHIPPGQESKITLQHSKVVVFI